jgi:hypothetical protein
MPVIGKRLILVGGVVTAALLAACSGEDRPRVDVIGGSDSASVSVSASGPGPDTAGSPRGSAGLSIPAGLSPETSGPSRSDGIYTPTTNREAYQKISSDYQEIVALTNQVNEGKPLPAPEILLLYEAGMHTRIGTSSRSLRLFAREADRAREFPEEAAFYGTPTFLDTEINDAITGARTAANYTPAQRRQAIQKGVLRILYYWTKRYLLSARESLNPGLVDEAWAIYVGEEKDGVYPNSLAGVAQSREQNFNRPGALDAPLRRAMSRAQKAAAEKDQAMFDAAASEVYSRFNAIFYLSTVRYLNESLRNAESGSAESTGVSQIEGLSYYLSIQPQVAKADATADAAIVAYFKAPPSALTAATRDATLAALNRTSEALLLKQADLVTSFQ